MTWQQTIDEEKDIAFEEGVKHGIEQGIAQGIERGAEEKALEFAKAMLADGVDINLIVKYTGLPAEKIEKEL
ncbi:MAG: hypothetical protein IKR40_08340 [Treponema sp.]|nr:hypothetical protein [Treponema sp.]